MHRAFAFATFALALTACSTPYGALMTPELLSRVEGRDAVVGPRTSEVCPDRSANASEAYGGHRRIGAGDSLVFNTLAGGRADLESCFGHEGFSSIKPDAALSVTDASRLEIEVQSNADTVLLVKKPGGQMSFDDDDGEGSNGKLVFEDPSSGTYLVWVGTFSADAAFGPRATISVIAE